MKMKLLLGTLLVCIASVFTACSDDNDSNPQLGGAVPSTFTVNTPALSDQYVLLSKTNTVHLTWSQPVYDYSAYISYRIQVGLPQADGTIKWNKDSKTGADAYLETVQHQCSADLNGEEFAWALSNIDGFKTIDDYKDQGVRKVAVRIKASIDDGLNNIQTGTEVVSNTVYFNQVQSYAAVKEPGWIYIVGSLTGWNPPTEANKSIYDNFRVTETAVNSNIYTATFEMASGEQFRFWTKLTGWDTPESYGLPSNTDIKFDSAGKYDGTISENSSGNYTLTGFAGGKVKVTVNLNTNKVSFVIVQ